MNRSTRNKIVGGAALAAGIYAGIQYARRRHRRSLPALAADTFRHERVNVNGVALHCAISGAGPTVLMLHGFPEAWFLWEPLLSKLPEWNYQGVAPDMRGYNLSDKPANIPDYRLSELVEDVRGLLEQYSPGRKAVLIGHDWGGIVAWAFAAAYPEMLEKLVILNAPHPNVFARELTHNPAQQMASSYAPLFRSRFAETALSAFDCFLLRKMMFRTAPPGTFSPQKKAQLFAAWTQPGALTGGLNYYRAMDRDSPAGHGEKHALARLAADFQKIEMRIEVPTLVVWGESDPALRPGCLDGLEKYVPNLIVHRLPKVGHWVLEEEPEYVSRLIRDFLDESA